MEIESDFLLNGFAKVVKLLAVVGKGAMELSEVYDTLLGFEGNVS